MHAIAISSSPRERSNTDLLLRRCLDSLAKHGVTGELVTLRGKTIKGCRACEICRKNKDKRCNTRDDDFHPIFEAMLEADIIVVGSPVYFGSATALVKGLLERAGYANRGAFSGKVGGPIVVARRAGKNFTFAELNFWFHISGMINPGSTYWNVGIGREPGQVEQDEEGMRTVWNFGKNIARVVKALGE